jgi:hypothetical protein
MKDQKQSEKSDPDLKPDPKKSFRIHLKETLFTYFKAGQGRGSGLGGDHAAEPCHTPGAHVVVLGADGHQVLLRQRHLRHGRSREYTRVRERTWLYLEQTDTRYFSDSVTFVMGDLESTYYRCAYFSLFSAVLRIRIRILRIHMFLGLRIRIPWSRDTDPNPDPSIIKQK